MTYDWGRWDIINREFTKSAYEINNEVTGNMSIRSDVIVNDMEGRLRRIVMMMLIVGVIVW